MIQKHYKRANIAAGIWAISMVGLMVVLGNTEGNIWAEGNILAISVAIIYPVSLWATLWLYAKAKGYSGVICIPLMFLSFFGLIILLSLRDKAPSHEDAEET